MRHHWTKEDDLAVLYLYRYGTSEIPYTKEQIAQNRGMSLGSLYRRLGNFCAVSFSQALKKDMFAIWIWDIHDEIMPKSLFVAERLRVISKKKYDARMEQEVKALYNQL
jgi:hypothetical protein